MFDLTGRTALVTGASGGIGGAMVALSDRTDLSLAGALGINFGLAITLACIGAICARRIASR